MKNNSLIYSVIIFSVFFVAQNLFCSSFIEVIASFSDGFKYSSAYDLFAVSPLTDFSSFFELYDTHNYWIGDFSPLYFLTSFLFSSLSFSYPQLLIFTSSLFVSLFFFYLYRVRSRLAPLKLLLFVSSFYFVYIAYNNPRLLFALIFFILYLLAFDFNLFFSLILLFVSFLFHSSSLLLIIPFAAKYLSNHFRFTLNLPYRFYSRLAFCLLLGLSFLIFFNYQFNVFQLFSSKFSYYFFLDPNRLSLLSLLCISSLFVSSFFFRLPISLSSISSFSVFLLLSLFIGSDKINPLLWFLLFFPSNVFRTSTFPIILVAWLFLFPKLVIFIDLSTRGIDYYAL